MEHSAGTIVPLPSRERSRKGRQQLITNRLGQIAHQNLGQLALRLTGVVASARADCLINLQFCETLPVYTGSTRETCDLVLSNRFD